MSWEQVKLGDIATFVNGYPFKPSDWSTTGLEIIRIQNLTKSNTTEYNYFQGTIPEKFKVIKGDILISWSATLGIFEWGGDDSWLNQHIFKVVFDKVQVDKNFFGHLILFVLDDLKKKVHGATMQHITKGNFDNTIVPFPPLPIQKKIADILDKADALRKKDQQLLQKYDELAQAIFIDMFGDPVKNEKGWEGDLLGAFFKDGVKCGPFGSALKREEYSLKGIPVWIMDNIVDYEFAEDKCLYIKDEKHLELKSYSVTNGDIIISRAGTVGKMCVVSSSHKASIISTNLIKLSLDDSKMLPEYFVFLMKYYGKQIGRLKKGSDGGFTHMNTGVLTNLKVLVPPISMQHNFINSIQIIKQSKKLLISSTNALFQSLLQQAFKGELIA